MRGDWDDDNGYGSGYGGRSAYGYRDDDAEPTDMGSALKDKVGISGGKLKVFGKEFDVGPQLAMLLRPAVTTLINQVSLRGASTAERLGVNLASGVLPQRYGRYAGMFGKGMGLLWLFGLSAADIGLGLKKTIADGYLKETHALRDQAQPLLDATQGKSDYGVLADARARIHDKLKSDLYANAAGAIRVLPTIGMGVLQYQLNNIRNPVQTALTKFGRHPRGQDRKEALAMVQDLKSRQVTPAEFRQHWHMDYDAKSSEGVKRMRELRRKVSKGYTLSVEDSGRHEQYSQDNILMRVFNIFTDPKKFKRLKSPYSATDYQQSISDLTLAPALTDVVGELLEKQISKKEPREIAWDKILELQEFVTRHKKRPDHGEVANRVRDIFQQRAKDLGRRYELEGQGFDRVVDAIATEIVSGLHPQALAEILDNKKIVSFDPKDADFGEMDEVRAQLDALKDKYVKKVSEKQFYQNAPFTKETLLQSWKETPEEERPFLAMLAPRDIWMKAGISREEYKKNFNKGRESFTNELVSALELVMSADREELKKLGVRDKVLDRLDAFRKDISRSNIEQHAEEAKEVVRDIAVSAKDKKAFWQNYLKKRDGERALEAGPEEEILGEENKVRATPRSISPHDVKREADSNGDEMSPGR